MDLRDWNRIEYSILTFQTQEIIIQKLKFFWAISMEHGCSSFLLYFLFVGTSHLGYTGYNTHKVIELWCDAVLLTQINSFCSFVYWGWKKQFAEDPGNSYKFVLTHFI